jgi:hypothetical protein
MAHDAFSLCALRNRMSAPGRKQPSPLCRPRRSHATTHAADGTPRLDPDRTHPQAVHQPGAVIYPASRKRCASSPARKTARHTPWSEVGIYSNHLLARRNMPWRSESIPALARYEAGADLRPLSRFSVPARSGRGCCVVVPTPVLV